MGLKTKLYISIILLTIVLTIGISGFMFISNETFIDALYMTIITMSTVGFGTLHKLTEAEKLFTIFLIIISISTYGYAVTAITEYLTQSDFFKLLKYKKVHQKIQKLENHTIVCGYGRNGKQAVNKLRQFNEPCVVIEKRTNEIADLERDGVLYVEGDATNDDDLKKVGLAANISDKFVSIIHLENTASIKVAEKNGMSRLFDTTFMNMEVAVFGDE